MHENCINVYTCRKCLLHNGFYPGTTQILLTFSNRIYPGTTQILLTINVNTRLQSCELSTPLPMGVIVLAISINRKLAALDPKLKGTILNLFIRYNLVIYLRH